MALRDVANGHHDRGAGIAHGGAADNSVGRLHRDGAHHVVADVKGDLKGEHPAVAVSERHIELQCVEQLGHRLDGELNVDDGSGDPGNAPDAGLGLEASGHDVPSPY